MTAVSELKEVVDGLLKLQERILKREPWLKEEAEGNIGNVAQIEVYDLYGAYRERLKLDPGLKIVRTGEKAKHLIRMHIDTFLDLLSGEITFGDAYIRGEIEFIGEDYHFHAVKWSKAFERLRKYLNLLKRR